MHGNELHMSLSSKYSTLQVLIIVYQLGVNMECCAIMPGNAATATFHTFITFSYVGLYDSAT